jgi:AbrB family looped-hinge helix DNA binding protein
MRVELREKSQMTIPKPLVDKLDLKAGDEFDIVEENGVLILVPMERYPKPAMQKVQSIVAKIGRSEQADHDALAAIKELFGSMSGTSMSADAFAEAKLEDLELE